ncbi:1-deoxy-D-xylulose-5-phosphate reductoisomerase [Thermospira aquatica]|uniref:1-deoxy-D-xylulose 5-phosphate reductoisomerase n=1 Tax=Thermospira aquatica TaxID=2828656 RepID=A0AAX3BBA0_9SPIR|nr:1-deoxy-D-xylulose-5-phosphate reductoisomerase [Thermospira aquatica]URA09577.1 1-deoxy-D-xylulose-5-phosphate reductoisomerase [Thermospira aquatica]
MPKKVVLLGGTGSIGSSVLSIIRSYPEEFQLLGLSGHSQKEKIRALVEEFHPAYVCLPELPEWRENYRGINFLSGEEGLNILASLPEADMVVIAIAGLAGLGPTMAAIQHQKHLLSANKESIVAAGPLINASLDATNRQIIPLDSEHNAIFTLLTRFERESVKNIILTASGGPFFKKPADSRTSLQDVLKHPTWSMGSYITVNSATMLNKGFEVLEAHYLFRIPFESIRVLIHPQSLVHGIVELTDGTQVMVASPSDMRYPIGMAMFYPRIPPRSESSFSLVVKPLEFFDIPEGRFPLLKLAYEMGKKGGLFPLALNALNEEIVGACLEHRIRFIDIEILIEKGLERFSASEEARLSLSWESLFPAEKKARAIAQELIEERQRAN